MRREGVSDPPWLLGTGAISGLEVTSDVELCFSADAFAKKLGYATELRAGLVKLQEENLSSMNTDPWYSAYHYSHPPLVERLAALDDSDKKKD
ncbi:CAAX prenyl protease 1 [Asimina triloba]